MSQDALTNSELQDGNTIMIASGTYTGNNNTRLDINNNLTFEKYGDGEAIFDAESKRRIWNVYAGTINITGLTFKNGKSTYGGAIYFDNLLSNSNITAVFINNTADNDGSAIYFSNIETVDITGRFINNTGENVIYINQDDMGNKIHDSIFINNDVSTIFHVSGSPITATLNWFGNNATNYNIKPKVGENVAMTNWLFLNATTNTIGEITINETSEITFKLYAYNSVSEEITEYDASKMNIQLDLSQMSSTLNKTTAFINETVLYTRGEEGFASVTGKFETASYTILLARQSTEIIINDVSISYGQDAVLVATFINNATGEAAPNAHIVTTIDGKSYTVKTNSQGKAKFTISGLTAGNYTAAVSYNGNFKYNPTSTTANVRVDKAGLTLYAGDVSITYNDGDELVATLTNNGKAVVNAKLIFTINGASYTVKTNSNGQAKLSTDGLVPGNYVATIVYNGNDKYNAVNTTANIHVAKANLLIYAPDVAVEYNDNGEFAATLYNLDKVVVNAKVIFNINGAEYTAKTNSYGQAIISTNGLVPGDYAVNIVYKGSDKYNPADETANIYVDKADVSISAVYDDETDKLIATFENAVSGKPVINAHVNIKIDGVDYAAITDANGQAKVSTASLTPGDYTADISYKGNTRYNPSSTTYDFKVEALLK